MRAGLLALTLVLAGCGPSSSPIVGAPTPSMSAIPAAGSITWPAISAYDSDSFGVDISGTGSAVSKVDIRSRYGTVSLGASQVSALVYWQIPFSGYILYQALAVEAHSWTVFWFYCRGRALTYVYWESTGSSVLNKAPMNGLCTLTTTTQVKVSWPAVSMVAPASVTGFSAHGALLQIDSAVPGTAAFSDRTWTLYPYAVVDCSKACGSPGWYELHSLLWDSQAGEAAFGIFYFITGHPDQVQLEYGLELPTLGRFATETFAAHWTRTP